MKKYKKWSLCLMSAFMITGLLGACGNDGESDSKANADSKETSKKDSSKVYSGAELEKYNVYVNLSNAINTEFNGALNDYYQAFADENGKFKKPTDTNSLYVSEPIQTTAAIDDIKKFIDKSPSFPMDKEANKLIKDVANEVEILSELKTYYESNSYVDDDFKKAETLHNKLLETVDETNKEVSSFNEKMDKVINKQQEAAAKEMKDSGKITLYRLNDFITQTENLITELQSQEINAANVLELDVPAFQKKYDEFAKSYDALIKASKDKKQLKKEDLTESDLTFILPVATKAKADASALVDRVNKKEAIDQTSLQNISSGINVDGTPEKLMTTYNDLVNNYNSFINLH